MKYTASILLFLTSFVYADYPDQHKVARTTELWNRITTSSNVTLSADGNAIELTDGFTSGYFILEPDTFSQPFNRGLPSWNGRTFSEDSGFKTFLRFKEGSGWSPWLTVGYWKNHIWDTYGTMSYSRGEIDYDYAVLDDYHTVVQWQVILKRESAEDPAPGISKLSFFASDQETTTNIDHPSILADNPPPIFYPTDFVCQYNVDPEIGGSICSPTSTVLAIRSYDIDVDTYDFAVANYDEHFRLFGIWPRAVQNASRFHMDGAVTRYRTWSEAYDTLAAGGRVVMSVGRPLYAGHLMMLAGFNEHGNPIVHDPAQQNGNAYVFDKADLGSSWFNKGGVSYTFFLDEASLLNVDMKSKDIKPRSMVLHQNYPNPFNASTNLHFTLTAGSLMKLEVYDLQGRYITTITEAYRGAGEHEINWNAEGLSSGVYFLHLSAAHETQVKRIMLLK